MEIFEESCAKISIAFLPNEILELIWMSNNLKHKDICRLGAVCGKFKDVSNSNNVWKKLFRKR